MTDKELRKLDRAGILQLLLEQSKETEALREQLAAVRSELQAEKEKPSGTFLAPENAGSIAEAALQVTDIFAQAQKAADEYLRNIALMQDRQAEENARRERESEKKAQEMIAQAEEKCRRMEEEARIKCEEMIGRAELDVGSSWREIEEKIESLKQASEEMQSLLKDGKKRFQRG